MSAIQEVEMNAEENDLIAKTYSIESETEEPTIYLSGPIRKAEDNGVGWREELIKDYSDSFDFINPLDKYSPETHEILNDPIDLDESAEKEQVVPSEYVAEDKMGIMESDVVFLGLPEVIARGSVMEVTWAYMTGTPFFVWRIDHQEESGWIFHHSIFMDDNRDNVMKEIENYV